LALSKPAIEADNVFISLATTADDLIRLLDGGDKASPVFIRASVATGKSTLANYLVDHFPDFIKVPTGQDEMEWRHNIVKLVPSINDSRIGALADALEALADKTLVVDEAHLLFSYPQLTAALFKLPEPGRCPRFLLFSAAARGEQGGINVVTPSEIRKKYMWYPPMPDSEELAMNLKEASVSLSVDSIRFFMKLCGGHRGIFMSAMDWVRQEQEEEDDRWDIDKSVTEVRASLAKSATLDAGGWHQGFRGALAQSRAIRVNSKYSELANIPPVFAKVLVGGSRKTSELEGGERVLTIAGFLVPERLRTETEFVAYDWVDAQVRYAVSNSMMSEYYSDKLSFEMHLQSRLIKGMDEPSSCADLLARALPFMSFSAVVDTPIPGKDESYNSPLSADLLPFEDHYNAAIGKVLSRLKYRVSTPLSNTAGKTDVVVTFNDHDTCAIETIMTERRLVGLLLFVRLYIYVLLFGLSSTLPCN
jgi:hypothetical protein